MLIRSLPDPEGWFLSVRVARMEIIGVFWIKVLCMLVFQLGEPKDSVRTPVRTIVQLVTELVSPPKIFPLIVDGLKTKNSRQRTECLQVLEQLLDTTGMAATTTPAVGFCIQYEIM